MKDYSGKKLGEDLQIEVLCKTENKRGSEYLYKLICYKCKFEDPELFNDGIFYQISSEFNVGQFKCGCRKSVRWTEEQNLIRINRMCNKKNYELVNYDGELNTKTKLKLKCNNCGNIWSNCTVGQFVLGRGCFCCASKNLAKKKLDNCTKTIIDNSHIKNYYPEGYLISRDLIDNKKWWVYCPICDEDIFSKAGLSGSVFTTCAETIRKGSYPCRCGNLKYSTKEMRILQANVKIKDQKLNYEILGLEGTNINSKFTVKCLKEGHGVWKPRLYSFLYSDKGCPKCAKYGYKQNISATLYVFKVIDSNNEGFTGFGITNNFKERLSSHKGKLNKKGYFIKDVLTWETDGISVLNVETDIKRTFIMINQGISGFMKESASLSDYDSIVKFVENNLTINDQQNTIASIIDQGATNDQTIDCVIHTH